MITNLDLIIKNDQYFELFKVYGSRSFSITQIRAKTNKLQSNQDIRCDDVAAKFTS